MGSLDLFISDPLIVDLGLFGAWLEGLRVEEAVGYEGVSPDEALQELVLADCSDQFRLFWMLQPYFMDPTQPAFQRRYRMLPAMRRLVLDAYYGFDERVMRELLGRKPAPKLRREIEGLREKLNVSQRSVRRQFDNLRRIHTAFEDNARHGFQCYMRDEIMAGWLLSESLAAKYTCVLFLFHSGFKVSLARYYTLPHATTLYRTLPHSTPRLLHPRDPCPPALSCTPPC